MPRNVVHVQVKGNTSTIAAFGGQWSKGNNWDVSVI